MRRAQPDLNKNEAGCASRSGRSGREAEAEPKKRKRSHVRRRTKKAMRQPKQRIPAQGLDLKDQVISINRVTKVVKGGKNLSFAALVVVGDEGGHVGFGTGKAREVPLAIKKGVEAAKKNLIRVPLIKNTLPHQLIGKFGAGRVLAEAGFRRNRRYRRRRGARGYAGGRRARRAHESSGLDESAQRRARDVRRPAANERSDGSGASARQAG